MLNTYDYGVNRIRSRGETDETYLYDGHGSVAGVVNPKNEFISYRYTAYGNLLPSSPMPCVYGYNAEDTDYSTGMQYLRARYYDVNLGRFTQKDKARGETLTPQTLNRYLYVGNNPINRIDPSGYGWISNAWNKTIAVVKKAATSVANTAKKVYNYAKTTVTNAFSSSSSNNRGNTNYQSSSGGGGGGSWGTEAYSNKQGQAVKGNKSSAPSNKGFPPLAINPDGKILGFLGKVCDKTKEKWDNTKAWLGDPQNQKALLMGGAIAVGVILTVATAGALGPVAAMAIGGAVAAGGTTLVTDKFDDGQINIKENWKTYAVNMAGGAIVGAAAGIAGPAVLAGQMSLTAGTAAMTGIGFANSGLKQSVLNDGKIDYGQALKEGVTTGLLFGVFTGAAQLLSGSNSGITTSKATYGETSTKYSPAKPGPLKENAANTFNGGTYKQTTLETDTVFYRVSTNEASKVGSFMSRTPQVGGMQSQLDLALNPEWGNSAQYVSEVTVPRNTIIYEGTAAPQVINGGAGILPGGGSQVYIPEVNPLWFK